MSFKKGKAFFFGFFSKLKKLAKYLVSKTKAQCSIERKNVLESDANIFERYKIVLLDVLHRFKLLR